MREIGNEFGSQVVHKATESMMLRLKKDRFTVDEYLAMERVADYKSEYYSGEIFALAGGTVDHNTVTVNCAAELRQSLDARPCYVFASDMRLHVQRSNLFTYPDVMVICGKIRFFDRRNDTVLNPILVVEVLSESTREYDRGAKFDFYKQIPELQEYILIESEQARVEAYRREADGHWTVETISGLDADLPFVTLDCVVPLRRIYHKVSWLD